jgi:enoyl-CoA hydratase
MSTLSTLLLDLDADTRVATLTFDRPERLNAYDRTMQLELLELLRALDVREDIGALVITGSGRAFMAGADISTFEEWSHLTRDEVLFVLRNEIVKPVVWQELGKPVVAAVNGVCVGAGLATAMAADFRFASPTATFGHTAITLGITPGPAETAQTVRYLGRTLAAEVLLAGRILTAEEALGAGLLNRLVEADDLLDAARAYATQLALLPTHAMRLAKANFSASTEAHRDYEAEIERFATSMTSTGAREGFKRFLSRPASDGRS